VRGSLSLKGRGSCTKIVARSAPLLFGERVRVRGYLSLKGRGIRTTIVAQSAPSPLWGEGWGEGFPLPQEQRDPHKKERHGQPPLPFGERVGVRGSLFLKSRGIRTKKSGTVGPLSPLGRGLG